MSSQGRHATVVRGGRITERHDRITSTELWKPSCPKWPVVGFSVSFTVTSKLLLTELPDGSVAV